VIGDRVASDQQGQLYCREERTQPRVPTRRALGARRQVAASDVAAGIAQTDGHDRYSIFVVKGGAIEGEPLAQSVAAAIVEREAGLVHP